MMMLEKEQGRGKAGERRGRLESNQRELTGSPGTSRHSRDVPFIDRVHISYCEYTLHMRSLLMLLEYNSQAIKFIQQANLIVVVNSWPLLERFLKGK
jgi:hypothetical protein